MNDQSLIVVGSLATLDPFQREKAGIYDPRPIPGQFIRSNVEVTIDSWLAYFENPPPPMTLHEMAYWGIAPKSCL